MQIIFQFISFLTNYSHFFYPNFPFCDTENSIKYITENENVIRKTEQPAHESTDSSDIQCMMSIYYYAPIRHAHST